MCSHLVSDVFCVRVFVAVHPLAIVGITGIIVNALNLMPIGSLDGGRIAMSAFGRKAGGVLGTVTLLLQVGGVIAGLNSISCSHRGAPLVR